MELFDPTIYRCNLFATFRTGSKYKSTLHTTSPVRVVDSIEGVTHAFRSAEYTDRNVQYENVDLACAHRKEFKRPEMKVYSRLIRLHRFIETQTQLVRENGLVRSGWNDPRFLLFKVWSVVVLHWALKNSVRSGIYYL